MFLKDAWYVGCTSIEIESGPLGRRICNERMVFFRGEGGLVAALEDFCPHRGAPLSRGRVVDGHLVCGYHGLQMGCEGRTVAMPGQRVRGFPPIRAFPAVERHGFVWVWPGDPSLADPKLIPPLPWSDDPAWAYGGGVYHVACDYRLMLDNLMDLSHETYVHETSIGQKEIDETPCMTKIDGDAVTTSRHMTGIQAPPFWRSALEMCGLPPDARVDRWQICRYSPPAQVLIDVGVALEGRGGNDAPNEVKASGIVVDLLTPETEESMWYFWGLARRFNPGDAALTDTLRERQGAVFNEDVAMLEAQHISLRDRPGHHLLMLNIDAGGVQARKVLERLLAAQRERT
jgi:vanillate O-demethylase monooxygenase subunit